MCRSDTESAVVKESKKSKYNLNFQGLFKRKPDPSTVPQQDDSNDDAARSEATVIIEDDPPKSVRLLFIHFGCGNRFNIFIQTG